MKAVSARHAFPLPSQGMEGEGGGRGIQAIFPLPFYRRGVVMRKPPTNIAIQYTFSLSLLQYRLPFFSSHSSFLCLSSLFLFPLPFISKLVPVPRHLLSFLFILQSFHLFWYSTHILSYPLSTFFSLLFFGLLLVFY